MNCWKISGWLALGALGCGGSQTAQGTEPHDMSATEHEASAGAEQAEASKHAGSYDAAAVNCTAIGWGEGYEGSGICWTSTDNPTSHHLAYAARHRELAEQHRAASQSLREAEAMACAGIAEPDRTTSPFYHRDDITSVETVDVPVQRGAVQSTQLAGAKAVFRVVPGLTQEKLQRLVDCHIARSAALGHDVGGMEYCPLVLKGVRARVSAAGDGLAVEVVSDDAATAAEILRRMQSRSPTPSSP